MRLRLAYYDLLFLTVGLVSVTWALIANMLGKFPQEELIFANLTVLLLLYVMWEARRAFREERWNALMMPPVLATIMTFAIGFGIGNFFYLGPSKHFLYDGTLGGSPFYWMNLAMLCILVASFAMCRGYHSRVGKRLGMGIPTGPTALFLFLYCPCAVN